MSDYMTVEERKIPIIEYEASMGKYTMPDEKKDILERHTIEEQLPLFRIVGEEYDDYEYSEFALPLTAKRIGGKMRGFDILRLEPDLKGIVVDGGLIIGIKLTSLHHSSFYLLYGNEYEDSYCPMFEEDYGGGQGDTNWTHLSMNIDIIQATEKH